MTRASKYSPEFAAKICEDLAAGLTLTAVCAKNNVTNTTIYQWTRIYPEFRQALTDARDASADILAAQVIDIADSDPDPQRARNRIEARKWNAAAIRPKVYGNRIDVEVSTPDIRQALHDARARALPGSDQRAALPAQPAELTDDSAPGLTDSVSVAMRDMLK